jgi:hypothetical protein
MEALASAFPLLVFLGIIALLAMAFRLSRRISRGSRSAGPIDVIESNQVGLQRTPWELASIDDQLQSPMSQRHRIDLINTINRLTKAAGETDPRFVLDSRANNHQIAHVVDHLERRLELGPPVWETSTAHNDPIHEHPTGQTSR